MDTPVQQLFSLFQKRSSKNWRNGRQEITTMPSLIIVFSSVQRKCTQMGSVDDLSQTNKIKNFIWAFSVRSTVVLNEDAQMLQIEQKLLRISTGGRRTSWLILYSMVEGLNSEPARSNPNSRRVETSKIQIQHPKPIGHATSTRAG